MPATSAQEDAASEAATQPVTWMPILSFSLVFVQEVSCSAIHSWQLLNTLNPQSVGRLHPKSLRRWAGQLQSRLGHPSQLKRRKHKTNDSHSKQKHFAAHLPKQSSKRLPHRSKNELLSPAQTRVRVAPLPRLPPARRPRSLVLQRSRSTHAFPRLGRQGIMLSELSRLTNSSWILDDSCSSIEQSILQLCRL